MPSKSPPVSIEVASERTGISPSTLRLWCADGKLIKGASKPYEGHRAPWLIPEKEVVRLEAQHGARDFDPAEAKALRLAAGVSQAEAARELGMRTATNLSYWEAGRFKPRGKTAQRYREMRERWEQSLARKGTELPVGQESR